MSNSSERDYTRLLQDLMQRVAIANFKQLSRQAGVSEWQVRQLRGGKASQMRLNNLVKLSQALQVPLSELLATFAGVEASREMRDLASLQQEYERLRSQLEQQREALQQEFQQSSLEVLESWLIQWPTAARAAQQNQQLPAVKLLPLVRPVEQLMQQWGVEAIAIVGSEVSYDPQLHQLMDGTAELGDPVKVRYAGYRQGNKLLYRAKVSPLS